MVELQNGIYHSREGDFIMLNKTPVSTITYQNDNYLLFLYFNYLVSVTAGGPVSPRGHM